VTGPAQNYTSASVEYQNGPLFAGLGYAEFDRTARGDDKEMIFGAGYTMGVFEFKGNYMLGDQAGPNNKYTQVNLGASVGFGAGRLYGNLQQNRLDGGARGNGYAVTYSYTMSKRTNVYASYGTTRNNSRANFALSSVGSTITPPATALGADPAAVAVGLRHTF
jgi:predicted porin